MLEDCHSPSMEKNNKTNGRAGSGPSNKAGFETKPNAKQDASTSKLHRVGRRRESPCPRPEPSRKPTPQRNKGLDKRPRPRGVQSDGREWNNVANGPGAEVGSALHQGSKKLNLNHLLNFTYSPRGENGSSHVSHWGNGPWRNRKWWSTKKHKYNKEQFLQANCQFVVRAVGDYTIHATDPDLLVDWDSIELVRLPSPEVPSCPICLYQPVAAKMTRCGHIYCWACILHYLALSDKTWRKCPICYEAVHKTDLKSVVPLTTHQFLVGEEIVMRLMRRQKGSVFAMAKLKWKEREGKLLGLDGDDEDTCFAKLLTASPLQVLKTVVTRERCELAAAFSESKDDPESCFIEAALELVAERERCLVRGGVPPEATVPVDLHADVPVVHVEKVAGVKTIVYSCAFDNEEKPMSDESMGEETPREFEAEESRGRMRQESMSAESVEGATAEDLDIEDKSQNEGEPSTGNTGSDAYYFYQASTGQHIYLHALNARMLIQEYGSLENSPNTIVAKIVEKEGITMTEELRRRLRYLSHLPLSCEFEVVELTLRPPDLSKETMHAFEDEIEKRRRRRFKRARDERRRDRHIQEEENRKLGIIPKAKLNLESRCQFPDCTSETTESFPLPSSPSSSVATEYFDPPRNSTEDNGSAPSFAQMLRSGKATRAWGRHSQSSVETLPSPRLPTVNGDSDSDAENYNPVPDYHLSFGDAIEAALVKASLSDRIGDDDAEGDQSPGTNNIGQSNKGSKKKKKGKGKQLLFTTSMNRNK